MEVVGHGCGIGAVPEGTNPDGRPTVLRGGLVERRFQWVVLGSGFGTYPTEVKKRAGGL